MKRFLLYLLPVIIYASLIFLVSSIPARSIPSLFAFQDVAFHLIEYFLFALLLQRAIKEYFPKLIRIRRIYLAVAVAILYALSDEAHQYFVPLRQMSLIDVLVDSIGAVAGIIFYS